jgi:hypothetical protein
MPSLIEAAALAGRGFRPRRRLDRARSSSDIGTERGADIGGQKEGSTCDRGETFASRTDRIPLGRLR